MHILIFGGHECESTWLQIVFFGGFFYFPSACVLMLTLVCLRDDWQFVSHVSNHYTFATVYKGKHFY